MKADKQKVVADPVLFESTIYNFGKVTIRKLDVERDAPTIHDWVNRDYAVFWGMQGSSSEEVKKEYTHLSGRDQYEVFMGYYQEQPAFLLERYHPQSDLIANYYPWEASDCGIHVMVAPQGKERIKNFTLYQFQTIVDFVFEDPVVDRILVEPDIRNKKMFAICERIGFQLGQVVELPHKTAQLAFLTRKRYQQFKSLQKVKKRSAMNKLDNVVSAQQAVSHLQQDVWNQANLLLVKKAITEFSHELLIRPELVKPLSDGWNHYRIPSDVPEISYEFEGKPMALQHLWVKSDTIVKLDDGKEVTPDAVLFIKEFRTQLGLAPSMMPTYLEEIMSTLQGSAFKLTKGNPEALELAASDFQTIEQSMTEGHPGFVANNGRIGFDSEDYRSYAPEAGNSFSLIWLAGHKDLTVYAAIDELPYGQLIEQELGKETVGAFNKVISLQGLNPEDYYFIPMHPWQWFNKLASVFASEIARKKLICLGHGPDQYLAQQSIRTLFNISNPTKFYTKTALSILNMGFMRGLPLYYLGTAPKMAVWLEALLYEDPYIKETGFRMLGEIASVSYENPYFQEFGPHNDFNKMLASLWRESPMSAISDNQVPMTMAAFLHIDHHGNALLPELIRLSGVSTEEWLRSYLKAYLSPMVHCFYEYDLVFMPHGENIILVMEDSLPVSILLKDITEEACILSPDVNLPDHLSRMFAEVPEDVKLLSIFTDIFDGFFRYLAQILEEHAAFSETDFWRLVAENVRDYQDRFPKWDEKFRQYDLFADEFHLSCLNRLQLNNHKRMIDLDDPVALLQFAGKLKNPIAPFKEKVTQEALLNQ
ncbi:MAG: GNAT family N-acetyltransferase [Bacteroidota bacterium]